MFEGTYKCVCVCVCVLTHVPPYSLKQCQNESYRHDTFLDVPLSVKPFGASHALESVVSWMYVHMYSVYKW